MSEEMEKERAKKKREKMKQKKREKEEEEEEEEEEKIKWRPSIDYVETPWLAMALRPFVTGHIVNSLLYRSFP